MEPALIFSVSHSFQLTVPFGCDVKNWQNFWCGVFDDLFPGVVIPEQDDGVLQEVS